MKSVHLALSLLCQVLIASVVLHLATPLAQASPLVVPKSEKVDHNQEQKHTVVPVKQESKLNSQVMQQRSSQSKEQKPVTPVERAQVSSAPVVRPVDAAPVVQAPVVQAPVVQAPVVQAPTVQAPTVQAPVVQAAVVRAPVVPASAPSVEVPAAPVPVAPDSVVQAPVAPAPIERAPVVQSPIVQAPVVTAPVAQAPVATAPVAQAPVAQAPVATAPVVPAPVAPAPVVPAPVAQAPSVPTSGAVQAPTSVKQHVEPKALEDGLVVKGGLGPLHLLATTLCSYQPDRPVSDDSVNQLYARRAIVRKSLFDFMSLKFTNLEKLSSRLNTGLEVVPVKRVADPTNKPSHGWPVVGKCTAHDLKLMGEAAWCECQEGDQDCSNAGAPVVEGPLYNLTQHQLATLEAQATSTQECRRNALRYSKALFQHLAEDQSQRSESWPKLFAQISSDDCARKRMIDIINALSSFRTDTTSIRRDNVEFAFAMDDLRTKVLENEVNVPLTFDRHFIEVEQFLQQSVRLMLASVQPKRAKLTSMRYKSLMYGTSPNTDDQQQCVDLHQRLLSKNYPNDCNPTQFGQLPDVLRMTANSLELWSIERDLSSYFDRTEPLLLGNCAFSLVSSG